MTSTAPNDPETMAADATPEPACGLSHPVVSRCFRAGNKAFEDTFKERRKNDFEAREAGKRAYREAMPPLDGSRNIRAFIACVTYGILIDVFNAKESTRLLYAAQVAWGTVKRRRQKPASAHTECPPPASATQTSETSQIDAPKCT